MTTPSLMCIPPYILRTVVNSYCIVKNVETGPTPGPGLLLPQIEPATALLCTPGSYGAGSQVRADHTAAAAPL